MKYIQSMILAFATMLVISCGNMKGDDNQNSNGGDPKQYATTTEAAMAAKSDMLEAIDKVDFGVNKEKLRASSPGTAIATHNIDWDRLLNADTASLPEGIIGPENAKIVPLVNAGDVVTVVSLASRGNQYSVAALGDKQISSELDMVRKADPAGMQNEIRVYEIPNLQATIYAVMNGGSATYYTSYNNSSIRQGIDGKTLMAVLKADAQRFQKMYGDDIKKGKLVK